jgi:5'-methylthioadenosine phosphorylase
MATDYDCWHEGHDAVTVEQVVAVMHSNVGNAKKLVAALAPQLARVPRTCGCSSALKYAVMTAKDKITPEARLRLELLLGKYL